jgi:predicted site-specific integrase-resolvase
MTASKPDNRLLTPAEMAVLLRVDVRTLMRWDLKGKLPEGFVIRTPGGHRRYSAAFIEQILAGQATFRVPGQGDS